MEVLSNILDPIHAELSASVWDDPASPRPRLKAQHRKWIQRTVKHALETAGYSHVEQWLSLVLTGSLTTYQYGAESDCDVSLFVDAEVFPEWSRAELIGIMVSNVDGTILPGTQYPMQCFVVAQGISKDDLFRPGLRSGYDLGADDWLQPPERTRAHDIQAEQYGMYAYALEQADKMEKLLQYEPDKAVEMWHMIHKKRQKDQREGKGDFSLSNIIYKFLANRGLFKNISEASGEYIAKTAITHRQVAKFVYHPVHNHLFVGNMGNEEGEHASHFQLMQQAGINPEEGPLFGQISEKGHVETFGRPMITGFGQPPMSQNEAAWRLKKTLHAAFPEAQDTSDPETLNPRWKNEWTEPVIQYLGERPTFDHATDQPPPEKDDWIFSGV